MGRRPIALLLGGMLLASACARRYPGDRLSECRPTDGVLPTGTDPVVLVGSYHLILIASRGPATGASVNGMLSLGAHPDGVRGSASVALDSVGARRPGDIGSDDQTAPGVLALPQDSVILLRFGAQANRTDVQAFEGPYMVLHVRRIDDDRFSGSWVSGSTRPEAEGHFCAVRVRGTPPDASVRELPTPGRDRGRVALRTHEPVAGTGRIPAGTP